MLHQIRGVRVTVAARVLQLGLQPRPRAAVRRYVEADPNQHRSLDHTRPPCWTRRPVHGMTPTCSTYLQRLLGRLLSGCVCMRSSEWPLPVDLRAVIYPGMWSSMLVCLGGCVVPAVLYWLCCTGGVVLAVHQKSGHRAGCVDLLADVTQRIRPLAHVFGHIHEVRACLGVHIHVTQLRLYATHTRHTAASLRPTLLSTGKSPLP